MTLLIVALLLFAQETQPPNMPPPSGAGTLICHYEPTTGLWETRRVPQDQVEDSLARGDVLGLANGLCAQPTPEAAPPAPSQPQPPSTTVATPQATGTPETPPTRIFEAVPTGTPTPTEEVPTVMPTDTPEASPTPYWEMPPQPAPEQVPS